VVISIQAPSVAQNATHTASVAEGATDSQPSNNSVSVTDDVK
jgi:hypothetical protein